ncbi:MAG: hypothetical protein KAR06_04305 [Deltaproteobacteria bacterium]|nr:hypothetical protein [Deltaproteobacteria bacterium]
MCDSCNATTFKTLEIGDKFTDANGTKLMVIGTAYRDTKDTPIKGFSHTLINKVHFKVDAVVLESNVGFGIGELVVCDDSEYVQKIA